MENKIIDQQTKNVSKRKAIISFGLGLISSSFSSIILLNPLEFTISYLFNSPFIIFPTSIMGLILGILSLKPKPRARLIIGLAIGGIVFSLIGLILGLLLLPIVLYLGSGP
jgi:multisubunit Na+/H+ antiporter MnhB subunit